jgi:hypothetical protein
MFVAFLHIRRHSINCENTTVHTSIVTWLSMTIDGVWICNWIYWTLTDCNYNYSAVANSHTLQFTTACAKSSRSAVSSPVDDPLLPGSRSHRLAAISHQPPLITAISRLSCNHSCFSLYSLSTDHTENTASNSSSSVVCMCCGHYHAKTIVYRAIT